MTLRRYARARGCIDRNRHFRIKCFQHHGIGNHADVGAESKENDLFNALLPSGGKLYQVIAQLHRAKRTFLEYGYAFLRVDSRMANSRGNDIVEPPAVSPLNAVLDRKQLTFLGFQVVARTMGVLGNANQVSVKAGNLFGDISISGLHQRGSERTIDEIVLHIHYYKNLHLKQLLKMSTHTVDHRRP